MGGWRRLKEEIDRQGNGCSTVPLAETLGALQKLGGTSAAEAVRVQRNSDQRLDD